MKHTVLDSNQPEAREATNYISPPQACGSATSTSAPSRILTCFLQVFNFSWKPQKLNDQAAFLHEQGYSPWCNLQNPQARRPTWLATSLKDKIIFLKKYSFIIFTYKECMRLTRYNLLIVLLEIALRNK